jgi:hypothetical protein
MDINPDLNDNFSSIVAGKLSLKTTKSSVISTIVKSTASILIYSFLTLIDSKIPSTDNNSLHILQAAEQDGN